MRLTNEQIVREFCPNPKAKEGCKGCQMDISHCIQLDQSKSAIRLYDMGHGHGYQTGWMAHEDEGGQTA